MSARRAACAPLVFAGFCAVACSAGLRKVPTGEHTLSEAILVEYPPPPAQVEEIWARNRGDSSCAWLDGHWGWVGRRWEWQPGAAVVAPSGCYFAPNDLFWAAGKLHFRPARWYASDNPHRVCAAPRPCTPSAK